MLKTLQVRMKRATLSAASRLMLTVNGSLTPAGVAQMLYASTDDIKDPKEGHGRLNAQRALALAPQRQTNSDGR